MANHNLEWFYLQQWRQRQYQILQQSRTVHVDWKLDGAKIDIPNVVTLPADLELTNKHICDWLSSEYGWLVADWRVMEDPENMELI